MGEKKLRKVERGGEVASQGAAMCVSLNVCVSPSAAVIKKSALMKAGQDSFCMEG